MSPVPPNIHYISGFFDGEGCVTVAFVRSKGGVNLSPKIRLTVAQKTPEVIRIFKRYWGFGSVYENTKGIWRWEIGGSNQCYRVLNDMLPQLIVKQEVAKVAINLLTRVIDGTGRAARYGTIMEDEMKIRMALVDRIHQLNERRK